jgi:phosphoribosylanthranilate isomerase
MTPVSAKICGLSTPETVDAAAQAGARYIGFVIFPPSPRAVTPAQAAELAQRVPPGIAKVGLVVDPDDALLDEIARVVPLDMIQVHKVHDPQRLAQIGARVGLPMIAAAPIASADDVDEALRIAEPAQIVLFDAKPAQDATLPGGNGIAFDWRLLSTRRIPKTWMLAGGLTPENVADAVALTGAKHVDVSSGVESAPGVKDAQKIEAFVANTNGARGIPPMGLARGK